MARRDVIPEDDRGGVDLSGVLADLRVAIGRLGSATASLQEARPRIPWEACHPVPVPTSGITLTAGAGVLDQPDLYRVKDPYWWDLRSLQAWGFTAGTVTVTVNATSAQNGTQVAVFTSPGEFTWGSQHLLGPNDRLVWNATGITGTVTISGQAVQVATPWLPDYLM